MCHILLSVCSDSDTRRQQKRQCLGRLKCVHSILCCLHNIKMRDLRGRVRKWREGRGGEGRGGEGRGGESHYCFFISLMSQEPLSAATIRAIAQRPLHSLTRDHLHHDTHHHHHHHHHHHVSHITHTPTHHHHHPHTRFGTSTPTPHPHRCVRCNRRHSGLALLLSIHYTLY